MEFYDYYSKVPNPPDSNKNILNNLKYFEKCNRKRKNRGKRK